MSTENPLQEGFVKQIVIGLTGPFGSGCSTLAKVLESDYNFTVICLSDLVRMEWAKRNGKFFEEAAIAPRKELQSIGNELRYNEGRYIPGVLAEWACAILKSDNKLCIKRLVFDSIRNMGEVEFLRNFFPDFYLISLDCIADDRWDRKQSLYNGDRRAFEEDDKRDKNEEGLPYGQQVSLCVDDSDYIFRNDNDPLLKNRVAIEGKLSWKVKTFIDALEGKSIAPTEDETYMSMAYCASLLSKCFKRQVGAVIVDIANRVVSVGFNENPPPLKPCISEFGDCFREMHIEEIMDDIRYCPECGHEVDVQFPYDCPDCGINIYRRVVHDRALSRCSALHAEERAIINAGKQNLKDCILYVTAFPCFLCTHKILEVGIKRICYCESYPDKDGLDLFQKANSKGGGVVTLHQFEGVKARAFFRIFPKWRVIEEERMSKKRVN